MVLWAEKFIFYFLFLYLSSSIHPPPPPLSLSLSPSVISLLMIHAALSPSAFTDVDPPLGGVSPAAFFFFITFIVSFCLSQRSSETVTNDSTDQIFQPLYLSLSSHNHSLTIYLNFTFGKSFDE